MMFTVGILSYNDFSFFQAVGDRFFVNPARKGMEFHSKVAPTYGFFVNYTGKYTTLESLGLDRKDWGTNQNKSVKDYAYSSELI